MTSPTTLSMGLSAPLVTRSWSRPGCGRMATSGGAPPATAVLRTVGRLSPLDWYWALTPVLDEKPSRTFWKSACSVEAHFAHTVTLPPMFWPPPLLVALLV